MDAHAAIIGNLVAGLFGIGLAVPMLLGKVPRNPLYGFRTRLTLSSDEIWYPANRFAAKGLLIWGLLNLLAATLAYTLQPLPPWGRNLLILPPLSIILFMVISLIWVNKKFGHLRR